MKWLRVVFDAARRLKGFPCINDCVLKGPDRFINNLLAVLNKAGADASNVIRTTIYLVNLDDFKKVNKIYSDFFQNQICPARACIEVSALPKGSLLENDCVAYLG